MNKIGKQIVVGYFLTNKQSNLFEFHCANVIITTKYDTMFSLWNYINNVFVSIIVASWVGMVWTMLPESTNYALGGKFDQYTTAKWVFRVKETYIRPLGSLFIVQ